MRISKRFVACPPRDGDFSYFCFWCSASIVDSEMLAIPFEEALDIIEYLYSMRLSHGKPA